MLKKCFLKLILSEIMTSKTSMNITVRLKIPNCGVKLHSESSALLIQQHKINHKLLKISFSPAHWRMALETIKLVFKLLSWMSIKVLLKNKQRISWNHHLNLLKTSLFLSHHKTYLMKVWNRTVSRTKKVMNFYLTKKKNFQNFLKVLKNSFNSFNFSKKLNPNKL